MTLEEFLEARLNETAKWLSDPRHTLGRAGTMLFNLLEQHRDVLHWWRMHQENDPADVHDLVFVSNLMKDWALKYSDHPDFNKEWLV